MGEDSTMKDWFKSLWEDIKDDPLGFTLECFLVLLAIFLIFALIVVIYGVCTGQVADNGDNDVHGIIPVPMGKSFIFIPY